MLSHCQRSCAEEAVLDSEAPEVYYQRSCGAEKAMDLEAPESCYQHSCAAEKAVDLEAPESFGAPQSLAARNGRGHAMPRFQR
jgi:hypothetical protein